MIWTLTGLTDSRLFVRPNATFRFWIPDTRFCREDDQNLVSGVLKCPQPGYLRVSGIQNFEASGNLIPHFQVCSHPPCCLAATTCRLPGGSVASLWVPHVSWPLLSAAVAIAVLSRQPVLINSYHRGGVGCHHEAPTACVWVAWLHLHPFYLALPSPSSF